MKSRHPRNGGKDYHRIVIAVSLSVVAMMLSLCAVDYSGGYGESALIYWCFGDVLLWGVVHGFVKALVCHHLRSEM
jgi:hypothetical protein